jgi:recombination protein RecA
MARPKKGESVTALSDNTADNMRERIAKLTSPLSVPDPLAIKHIETFSSGFYSVDKALGLGGWAKGRLHVLEGAPGSGKTSIALASVGTYQRSHPSSIHALIDLEHTANIQFFEMLGVNCDPDRLIIIRPETAEEACLIAMNLMGYEEVKNEFVFNNRLKIVDTITYDSWGGSATKAVGMAALARVGSLWLPRLVASAGRRGVTLFWINQLRLKPGMSFGDPRYGAGGEALKYSATTKTWVTALHFNKDEDGNPMSHDMKVETKKSKIKAISAPIELHLDYKIGFDKITDILSFLVLNGSDFKETKTGNIYVLPYVVEGDVEEIRANGIDKFKEEIRSNQDAITELERLANGFL